ncbi:class I SAM-dependent methyltransferase [Streptomyces achromogenes]|uniref:class I SAM-dependent methyltransferase n=1 Tax=Streptomyces achromogenes TaxID=67255 RepID=UPI0004CBF7C3|nr:class I SAM-dependent methyltransferase [Streptomyces achromogenes]
MTKYILDNADPNAEDRMAGLERCYDPFTFQRLGQLGIEPGWTCLELGGGGGSVGRWLADRVTAAGTVVVTDIDPRWTAYENVGHLRVQQHDITGGEPIAEAPFDLIHARLVLIHLPTRRRVLSKLVSLLRPGGWLVLEEFDCTRAHVYRARETGQVDLFLKWIHAFLAHIAEAGVSLTWAREVYQTMSEAGLVRLDAAGYETASPAGSPGSTVHRSNASQLRPSLVASGRLTDAEYDTLMALFDDPTFTPSSYLLISTQGQRPVM